MTEKPSDIETMKAEAMAEESEAIAAQESGQGGDSVVVSKVGEGEDKKAQEEISVPATAAAAVAAANVSFVELLEKGPTPPPEINMILPSNHLDFSTILPSLSDLEGRMKS